MHIYTVYEFLGNKEVFKQSLLFDHNFSPLTKTYAAKEAIAFFSGGDNEGPISFVNVELSLLL